MRGGNLTVVSLQDVGVSSLQDAGPRSGETLSGGEVRITARLQRIGDSKDPTSSLLVSVLDTGVGVTETALAQRRRRGFGLANVEQRLQHYGQANPLMIQSAPGLGTTVEIRIPVESQAAANVMSSAKSV